MKHPLAPILVLAVFAVLPLGPAWAEGQPSIGAAPAGRPATVAQRVIHENFSPSVCERVRSAERLANGSIHATCANGEVFRVFEIGGRAVAMRCSAAARYGIEGC
jgi:hypothetical protein